MFALQWTYLGPEGFSDAANTGGPSSTDSSTGSKLEHQLVCQRTDTLTKHQRIKETETPGRVTLDHRLDPAQQDEARKHFPWPLRQVCLIVSGSIALQIRREWNRETLTVHIDLLSNDYTCHIHISLQTTIHCVSVCVLVCVCMPGILLFRSFVHSSRIADNRQCNNMPQHVLESERRQTAVWMPHRCDSANQATKAVKTHKAETFTAVTGMVRVAAQSSEQGQTY